MSADLADSDIPPCLCLRLFNWHPQVYYHRRLGTHPNPGPFEGGERQWHWYRCAICKTATPPFDNHAAARAFWAMLNRPEPQHQQLWKRDFDQRRLNNTKDHHE